MDIYSGHCLQLPVGSIPAMGLRLAMAYGTSLALYPAVLSLVYTHNVLCQVF